MYTHTSHVLKGTFLCHFQDLSSCAFNIDTSSLAELFCSITSATSVTMKHRRLVMLYNINSISFLCPDHELLNAELFLPR